MANLFNRSDHSLCMGVSTVQDYVKTAVARGDKGVGLCDIGTCSGLYDFINECNAQGIVPVPGLTVLLATTDIDDKEGVNWGEGLYIPRNMPYSGLCTHFNLFAYNEVGLKNLYRLNTIASSKECFLEEWELPRLTLDTIAKYSDGLIATSGDMFSAIVQRLALGQGREAINFVNEVKAIFGNRFFIELLAVEDFGGVFRYPRFEIIELARLTNTEIIPSANSFYIRNDQELTQEAILCGYNKSVMSNPKTYFITLENKTNRLSMKRNASHFMTDDEMKEMYRATLGNKFNEKWFDNVDKIIESARGNISLEFDPTLRPEVEVPEGMTELEYFDSLIEEGFQKLRSNQDEETQKASRERIEIEREVIVSNDFVSYFLAVREFVQWNIEHGYPIGPGRGSAGGSEIGYLLEIHKIDPLRYDLLFERFLSTGRGSIYRIEFESGKHIEKMVSYVWDNNKYTHQLSKGDKVHVDGKEEIISNLYIIKAGSSPDIDLDFHTEGRRKTLEYAKQKFGEEHVSNIITFGTYKIKNAFRTMTKRFDLLPHYKANELCKTIPDPDMSVEDVLELPSFKKEIFNEDGTYKDGWEECVNVMKDELNHISNQSSHPCGIIISSKPLYETIPCGTHMDANTKEWALTTEYEYPACESLGLLKVDFLGLDTVNLIDNTAKMVAERRGIEIDTDALGMGAMDDEKTYELFSKGQTEAVFQFSGGGVKTLLRAVQPKCLEDLAAITAIYRPGPLKLKLDEEYAERIQDEKCRIPIHKDFYGTKLEEILITTYGSLIYQEQLMKIASQCAGLSETDTDRLRKAVGKKKMDILNELESKFKQGMVENGYKVHNKPFDPTNKSEPINILWDGILGFGEYAFNKSHSVAYAINSYKCGYFKAHYTAEFMACAIQQKFDEPNKLKAYIREAMEVGLNVKTVDINTSEMTNKVLDDNTILLSFTLLKGIDRELIQNIVDERNKNGKFTSIYDFLERIKEKGIGEGALKILVSSGAFDSLGYNKKDLIDATPNFIKVINNEKNQTIKADTHVGNDLFDMFDVEVEKSSPLKQVKIKSTTPATQTDMISYEIDAYGFIVDENPLDLIASSGQEFEETIIEYYEDRNGNKRDRVMDGVHQIMLLDCKKKQYKRGDRKMPYYDIGYSTGIEVGDFRIFDEETIDVLEQSNEFKSIPEQIYLHTHTNKPKVAEENIIELDLGIGNVTKKKKKEKVIDTSDIAHRKLGDRYVLNEFQLYSLTSTNNGRKLEFTPIFFDENENQILVFEISTVGSNFDELKLFTQLENIFDTVSKDSKENTTKKYYTVGYYLKGYSDIYEYPKKFYADSPDEVVLELQKAIPNAVDTDGKIKEIFKLDLINKGSMERWKEEEEEE